MLINVIWFDTHILLSCMKQGRSCGLKQGSDYQRLKILSDFKIRLHDMKLETSEINFSLISNVLTMQDLKILHHTLQGLY